MNDTANAEVPGYVRFGIAGLSGMGATCIVQPLDLLKTRMQLSGEGGNERVYKTSLHALRTIVRQECVLGLYSGLTANLFRQATCTSCRIGIYQVMVDHMKQSGYQENLLSEIKAGIIGGFLAAFIGTPSDVALVRMAADGRLPPSKRRNYKNIFDALRRIAAEEGGHGVFSGFIPATLRTMITNTAQLVSYSEAKKFLQSNGYMKDDIKCQLVSSLFSGFVYTIAVCPLDVARTRMQYKSTETENLMYNHIGDALAKTVQKEGVTALWKGFVPLYTRCAPHTLLLFLLSEQLTFSYSNYMFFNL
ncbi:mitochondrial 2-oxoglutarate/malate carrier protein-like [Macrosteles quadrilineatus]|uniref:mitochondrial 2-oxoglutarate/malate carrier protein-like n=1 Tax=Macrosteles quadrilineatus TaxID=74068 RepID=UPI0023E2B44D|nr:mitochondrial 2-oxoglutarate/malate carrier protein-like [Macrosteles quadrilineatus]